ncbi:MAG TPA: hypothetical protein PLS10_07170 [Chitinophagales bacterium]|nr:hypothetical protein [Chitinophagales bacterium]
MDFGVNNVKLPAEVAAVFEYQKQVPKIVIKGIGEVDFTSISLAKAQKIAEKTGDKYLAAKQTAKTTVPREITTSEETE